MMLKVILASALIFGTTVPSFAADPKGSFHILGAGNSSCGLWTSSRKANDAQEYILTGWVQGYITAINFSSAFDTGDITKSTDMSGVTAYIDNYCSANPLNTVSQAALSLVLKLSAPK
jgi:hypothetical protein